MKLSQTLQTLQTLEVYLRKQPWTVTCGQDSRAEANASDADVDPGPVQAAQLYTRCTVDTERLMSKVSQPEQSPESAEPGG